jgi:threonine/homoserine/homoserine lactone efflux protein
MFEALISGLIAGWGVAVPLGAIGVMLVDLGMRGGFRSAAPAAAAVATADLLYAAVAALRAARWRPCWRRTSRR